MENPNLNVPCPTCGAEAGKRCRTMKTGRTTDMHQARWNEPFRTRQPETSDEPEGAAT